MPSCKWESSYQDDDKDEDFERTYLLIDGVAGDTESLS